MLKIAVLVSGGGTNLQAIIDAKAAGRIPNGNLSLVLSSKDDAFALTRAKNAGIDTAVISRKQYSDGAAFEKAMLDVLERYEIELIVLAGFMSVLGKLFVQRYHNRIINVHPSLIPSFCGDGFYGLRVHEAALRYGVKLTGATVHFVNEITDGGAIILQKAVPVREGDTAQRLQRRVMEEAEWELLPQAISFFCDGRILIVNGKTRIKDKMEDE